MARLIDADNLYITTITTDDYSGNEILDVVMKEDIDDAPTVEAIPKADYEARLKADMVAMLTEILTDFDNLIEPNSTRIDCESIIEQKINSLKES